MQSHRLPIPTGWRIYFREIVRRVRAQLNSPWTKLTVLGIFLLLATREEFSFSISVNTGSVFGSRETSVFTDYPGEARMSAASLASYIPPKREWTAKQQRQLAYVAKYRDVSLQEMAEHGIPASITLAQGLLESGTGSSTLATKNHNHFGIKCFSKKCGKGHCSNHSDDHHKDFFRVFDNPTKSYREHSKILLKERYRKLFDLSPTDYKGWALGLRKAGYATDPRYGEKLIAMIEDLELYRIDQAFLAAK